MPGRGVLGCVAVCYGGLRLGKGACVWSREGAVQHTERCVPWGPTARCA